MASSFSYHFDSELREVPDAPLAMRTACAALASLLRSEDLPPAEELQLLGRIGPCYRMLGELDLAEGYLRRAVQLAEAAGGQKALVSNKLRLADVLQWRGLHRQADSLYLDCRALCEVEPELRQCLHACCQHYGTSLFDQGRYEAAAAQFRRALDLRRELGDTRLIASSESALEAAERRRGAAYPVDAAP